MRKTTEWRHPKSCPKSHATPDVIVGRKAGAGDQQTKYPTRTSTFKVANPEPGRGHLLAPSHGLKTNHCRATDRAFVADWLRNDLIERSIIPAIPPKSNRKVPAKFDRETHKWQHLIGTYFCKLTENRGIALRSCKTDQSLVAFAATLIQTRQTSTNLRPDALKNR